jgi:S-formylglutathione hydrolase FrmB
VTAALAGPGLACGASVALNVSYVLQHRGAAGARAISPRVPLASLRSLLGRPVWAAGATLGMLGWGLHVGALTEAPLSVVQAFVAGGLALAVPVAAALAGERLRPGEWSAVAVLVLALLALSAGLRPHRAPASVPGPELAAWLAALVLPAVVLAARAAGPRRPALLGLAGGLLYGAADMAVKAVTEAGRAHGGLGVLVSPWPALAVGTTAGAFFCFQRGLQTGRAVPVIALMTAATNAGSIAGAFAVFGDPLGRSAPTVALHVAGFVLVAVGAWRLAPTQARLSDPESSGERTPGVGPRVLRPLLAGAGAFAVVAGGLGALYLLRTSDLLGAGPRLAGALPLQQLAGDAAQPLLRLFAAWGSAGAVAAVVLRGLGGVGWRAAALAPPLLGAVVVVATGAESDAVVVSERFAGHLAAQPERPALWAAVALLAAGSVLGSRVRIPRRPVLVAVLLGVVFLATGSLGAYAYGRAYWLYRGFPPPVDPPGVAPGRLVTAHFFSPALHARRTYRIYLPPGYAREAAAGERFPVLYLLHAAPGRPDTTFKSGAFNVRADVLLARHEIRPMLIVIPYGKSPAFHSDTEWANARAGRYEDFVLDAVRAVDRRWATIPTRGARGIGGYSEGGYGAVNIALHHLGTFGLAESWSGYFVQTPTAAFAGASSAQLRANSPELYVARLRPRLLRLPFDAFLYSGTRDDVAPRSAESFARRLRAAGGHATAAIYPGRHSWRLWRAHVPDALRFASARL